YVGVQWTARYQFSHILVQTYLYHRLSAGERRLMHRQVAEALMRLYDGQTDQIAVQLAHHFSRAGDNEQAFTYGVLAARNADRAYARETAIAQYSQAIDLAQRVTLNSAELAALHRERGSVHEALGQFDKARADFETCLWLGQRAEAPRVTWRALLDLAGLWTTRDYGRSRVLLDQVLELAGGIDDPELLGDSMNWVGNWWLNAEDPATAIEHHRQALAIFERLGDPVAIAHTLDDLAIAHMIGGDPTTAIGYYDQSIELFRSLGDHAALTSSLTGRGLARGGAFMSCTQLFPEGRDAARGDLDEALQIARATNSPAAEAWALWALSLLAAGYGEFGEALDAVRSALSVATEIGHGEWIVASRSILGTLYAELFASELAREELEQALALAAELRSKHWIHHATAGLALTCCQDVILVSTAQRANHEKLAMAESCLEHVLSPQAPMNTIHRRTCWARQAELALSQGNPSLALNIVERLVASIPGAAPGSMNPFLWQLKAAALDALGHSDEAHALLHTALATAQAVGARFLLWRIHAGLGHLCRKLGRASEADVHFGLARDAVQELADSVTDQDLHDRFVERAYRFLTTTPTSA
ncbi:MAG: tetratricopeptide repeat protein, partial [Anaerolineae bacterium]|nr:tetratricopeptide repeat protein [Anaerolineae bacterium]